MEALADLTHPGYVEHAKWVAELTRSDAPFDLCREPGAD
ncbi:hypothetical protein QFZ79_002625 [Arthrobacter sp. V4I6]|nr:hypothetical protein [Arthrobacter sp. V1I7]MDQ0854514.1 hypothetical protein [Arthrobacter sp. V4I6]